MPSSGKAPLYLLVIFILLPVIEVPVHWDREWPAHLSNQGGGSSEGRAHDPGPGGHASTHNIPHGIRPSPIYVSHVDFLYTVSYNNFASF